MENKLMTVANIRGYVDEHGTAMLNAEDVARGWGFTQRQNKNGKIYESIRWDRVNEYLYEFGYFSPTNGGNNHLNEFGFMPTSGHVLGKDDYLPENMVYRLGFKASNDKAQKFQAVLADEVLPAIRKHGAYMTEDTIKKALQEPDFIIKLATELKEEKEARKTAELEVAQKSQIINELKPKADYTDRILQSSSLVTITQIAKDYGMSGKKMNSLLHELKVIYKMGSQWLLYSKYQAKGYTHSETVNIEHSDGRPDVAMNTKWTQKGRLFLYELLKKHDVLPVIEQTV